MKPKISSVASSLRHSHALSGHDEVTSAFIIAGAEHLLLFNLGSLVSSLSQSNSSYLGGTVLNEKRFTLHYSI